MANLWRELAKWLAERPDDYRLLVLPDPGGWTRIGYTVKLAFPIKRDQRLLLDRLSEADLLGEDPAIGPVVRAVSGSGFAAFSQRFRDEFRALPLQSRRWRTRAELRSTPFWSAVRAMTDVPEEATSSGSSQWALIGSDDGYDLELSLMSDSPSPIEGLTLRAADDPVGRWTHLAERDGEAAAAAAAALGGWVRIPQLSGLAQGGVIPLVEELHGEFESGSRSNLPEATSYLIRQDLVEPISERFGGSKAHQRESGVPGWCLLENLRLTEVNGDDLAGSPLADCRLLHRSLIRPSIRLVGGVAIDGDWLGLRDLLPVVRVPEARSVIVRTGSIEEQLEKNGDGDFVLPRREFVAEVMVTASWPTYNIKRSLQFVRAPSAEDYRTISNPGSFVYEDMARSRSYARRWDGREQVPRIDDTSQIHYLGCAVGEFLPSRSGATFAVEFSGTHKTITALRSGSLSEPTARIDNNRLRRVWRKDLDKSTAIGSVASQGEIRSFARSAHLDWNLPLRPPEFEPTEPDIPRARPVKALSEAVAALAAVSNNSAGVERRWLSRILRDLLEIGSESVGRVLRAWLEAELIDEVVNVRWSGRRLVAVRPLLAVHSTDLGFKAVLRGLALESTRRELGATCAEFGLLASTVESVSPYVPKSIAIRASDLAQLQRLSDRLRIPLVPVVSEPFATHESRDLFGSPPTLGYKSEGSLDYDGIKVERCWRRGAPSYWSVHGPTTSTWSHFQDAALFWVQAMLGSDPVEIRTASTFVMTNNAYLPLTTARWLSSLGGPLAGPVGPIATEDHLYAAPTPFLMSRFLDDLRRFTRTRSTRSPQTISTGAAMLDPIGGFLRIREQYITYLETAFRIADPDVARERRDLLERPGQLCTEPYLEPVPRYESVDRDVGELADRASEILPFLTADASQAFSELILSGLFDSTDIALYQHQATMLAAEPKPAGPGS